MRHQDFRNSPRREFDADTFYPQPRAYGTRPRFSPQFGDACPGHRQHRYPRYHLL